VSEREGVVRHRAVHETAVLPAAWAPFAAVLAAWRRRFGERGWIGRDPARYGGYGFGNLSARLPGVPGGAGFLVTGSQTGGAGGLPLAGFAQVERWSLADNRIWSRGEVAASSESLTHAALYEASPGIGAVFHVHAPEPWRRRRELGLPETAPGAGYGTPAMAAEVVRAWAEGGGAVVAMAGHQDGLVAAGRTVDEAGERLLRLGF